ncbi:MAG: MarR family transcriptional regulator [Clostridia bacterium]|nr:MarR family transcriptional regulator [Clostridia bacterium]
MANRHHIMRNSSVFYRLTQMYFADKLKPFDLGPGQQYFLLQIERHPGASLAELADLGAFDNCTVTRAVQKLESLAYIRVERDERDHRTKRLYLTETGQALIQPIRRMIGEWMQKVTAGFEETDKEQLGRLMGCLADNARAVLAEKTCENN